MSGGRVLVVGPSKIGDMAWFVALAYRRLGWHVSIFDDRAYVGRNISGKLGKVLQLAEREYHLTPRAKRLAQVVCERARGCDHVITVKGEYFLPEQVAEIRSQLPIINWYPDTPMLDQEFDCIPHYTLFCPKDSWTTQRMRWMGFSNVVTLPHASDPEVLGGTRRDPSTPCFSVVGSAYPYRRHWTSQATALGLHAFTWGYGDGWRGSGQSVSTSGPALGAAQGEALRTGYFTLSTHHPKDVAGGNQRVFDAAAAGAPQLTEYLPETVRHFKPGGEVATFESHEEFCAAVQALTSDPKLRERLARNSYERACDEHRYEHRLKTLFGML